MENNELIKRAEDLRERCERSCTVTHTNFLTPAESYELAQYFKNRAGCTLVFFGGSGECERKIAFFLPEYMDEESFDGAEYISAVKLMAYFGTPAHRDYMGAILGLGIGRERIGDIAVHDNTAFVFCVPSVRPLIMQLEKAGRVTVKAEEIQLDNVPVPERKVKEMTFTVSSMRLDAVTGGMFGISRTEAAKQIGMGLVSVNYSACEKPDHTVRAGDIITVRGRGKGSVTGTGGSSRKGRLFVYAEVLA